MPLKPGVTAYQTTAGAAARCLAESELVMLRRVSQRRVVERQEGGPSSLDVAPVHVESVTRPDQRTEGK